MPKISDKQPKNKITLPKRSWEVITPTQKSKRFDSLQVLGKVRAGQSLTSSAKEVGISPQTVLRHVGEVIVKRKGKYVAKSTDRISRGMFIIERGQEISITVNGSRNASIVGAYHNAVKQALEGNTEALKEFEDIVIKDGKGVKHSLETNIKKIRKIEERKEEPEFFTIYDV